MFKFIFVILNFFFFVSVFSTETFGKTQRGFLGLSLKEITPDIAKSEGLNLKSKFFKSKNVEGVLISTVIPGESAEKGGLKAGDVILEFNGKKIKDVKSLQVSIAESAVGSKAEVKVWRNESGIRQFKVKKFTVILGDREKYENTKNQGVAGKGLVCTNSFWNNDTKEYDRLDPTYIFSKKYYYFVDSNSVKVFTIEGNDIYYKRKDYTLHETDQIRIKEDVNINRETLVASGGSTFLENLFVSTHLCEGYGSEREVLSIIENDIEEGMRKNKF